MKYKVGDKVRICSKIPKDLCSQQSYNWAPSIMDKYCGTAHTIAHVYPNYYRLSNGLNYKEDWLEPVYKFEVNQEVIWTAFSTKVPGIIRYIEGDRAVLKIDGTLFLAFLEEIIPYKKPIIVGGKVKYSTTEFIVDSIKDDEAWVQNPETKVRYTMKLDSLIAI